MTVRIYLYRHGIAEDGRPGQSDAQRALTEEGRRRVAEIATGLQKLEVRPDHILASPLVRAQETAAITAELVAPKLKVETMAALAFGEPEDVLAELVGYIGSRELMLVGHQPSLGELASQLLTGSPLAVPLPFKKGAIAAIELGSIPPRRPGELLWFAPPKMLRGVAAE